MSPTNTDKLTRIGVVGCGLMGSGIAEVAARSGLDVVVLEADEAAVNAGLDRLRSSLGQAVRRGKLSEQDRGATLGRINVTWEADALADRQLVVEAVPEIEQLKLDTVMAVVRDRDIVVVVQPWANEVPPNPRAREAPTTRER